MVNRRQSGGEPSGTMKAIHLYIGVFLGCATLVGGVVSIDRRMTSAIDSVESIGRDVSDLKSSSKEQAGQIQALRQDLQGVKLETNTWMAYQDGQRERQKHPHAALSLPGSTIQ